MTAPSSTSSRRQTSNAALAERIAGLIRTGVFKEGDHLRARELADRLHISRFPIAEALKALADRGLVRHELNRGFFVCAIDGDAPGQMIEADPLEGIYRAIAEDHLQGQLPEWVSAALMRERYELTQSQLADLMSRIVGEGWAQRRTGSGWTFLSILRTPEALKQTYRVRQVIEPAALLEPTFHMPKTILERCRSAEKALLDGAVETLTAEQLYQVGVDFHEAVMSASGNPFFLETLRRVNQARRLIAYRAMLDRSRYYIQAREHLVILNRIEAGDMSGASRAMAIHLGHVVENLTEISEILKNPSPTHTGDIAYK